MSMLFAKIDPVAQIPQMETPFQFDVITAEYITAIASPYRLGSSEVNFTVIYGNATFGATGAMQTFNRVLTGSITLASPEIDSWGLDDSVVLQSICGQIGTTAIEFIYGSPSNFSPI